MNNRDLEYFEKFRENVQALRKGKGLSREHLAFLANLTTVTVSNIENGKQFPNRKTLGALAVALNTSVRKLLRV